MYKMYTGSWHLSRLIFLIAGVLQIIAMLLAWFISDFFIFIVGFISAMQIFFALTGYCPAAILLYHLGVPTNDCK